MDKSTEAMLAQMGDHLQKQKVSAIRNAIEEAVFTFNMFHHLCKYFYTQDQTGSQKLRIHTPLLEIEPWCWVVFISD